MADEMNREEKLPEAPPGDQNSPEVGEVGAQEGVAELENLVAQKDEELTRANARLIELEQVVASQNGEMATLNQSKTALEERLTTISNSLTTAVANYKAMVVQANPEVLEELISGESIESINESLTQAKTLVSKVRQGVEAEILLAKVPAGAPVRTSPDLSTLSPREKIQYAIAGQTR